MQSNLVKRGNQSVHQETSASDIVAAFNTWAFKREQPDDVARLNAFAERSLQLKEPIEFVTYWGKGPRSCFAQPDAMCLDFLLKMLRRIEEVYEFGARLHVVMTDTHAHLNQHSGESIQRYFSEIEREGTARGFKCRPLTDVVVAAEVGSLDIHEEPSPALLAALRESAAKWYLGIGNRELIASQYFNANMREKRAIETQYPGCIFISFNNSNFRLLFPESLPVFYMYSLKRGVAVKPWFIGNDNSGRGTGSTVLGELRLHEAGYIR